MVDISVQLSGAKELEKALSRLERNSAKKIVRRGVRAGAKIIQQAQKSKAQSIVGGSMGALLSKNTIVKAFKRQRRGSFGVSVMFRPDVDEFVHKTADGEEHYIPNAIEYGHAAPGDAGGAKIVPAKSFVRTAYDETKEKALLTINKQIGEDIFTDWNKK